MRRARKKYINKASLMSKCITISLLVHAIVLYVFYQNPITLYATSIFQKNQPAPTAIFEDADLTIDQKEQALAEVFEEILLSSSSPFDAMGLSMKTSPSPGLENGTESVSYGSVLAGQELTFNDTLNVLDTQELPTRPQEILKVKMIIEEPALELGMGLDLMPLIEEINLPNSNILPAISYPDTIANDGSESEISSPILTFDAPSLEIKGSEDGYQYSSAPLPLLKGPHEPAQIRAEGLASAKRIIELSPDSDTDGPVVHKEPFIAQTIFSNSPLDEENLKKTFCGMSWSDSFDIDVKISHPTDAGRYVFSLVLTPKKNIAYEKIPQNFYFLIDPSSSIDRHKFSLFKRSILKSLNSMHEGDRFNIIVLDKKLSRMSSQNKTFNARAVQAAEDFLDNISQASFTSSVDIIDALQRVSNLIDENGHMHTALLLTNGQSSQGFQNQQKSIKEFIEKNGTKMSLYAAAVGSKNNLVNLDMLCSIAGGKLLYSDTNAAFPRKFSLLVKELKTPIAKDIKVSVAAKNSKAGIKLFTQSQQLPAFYAQAPYVIMGTIERLSDITLYLEAKNDSEWITIEKAISFQDAEVDSHLFNRWSQAQIATQYQTFLKDPKSKYLQKAKELLQHTYGKAAVE
jgi:hypothetical protein